MWWKAEQVTSQGSTPEWLCFALDCSWPALPATVSGLINAAMMSIMEGIETTTILHVVLTDTTT